MNTDFFGDQARFMRACGQTVGVHNQEQCNLYDELVAEELSEQLEASLDGNAVEEFDADLDILVVHIGRMLSRWHPNMIKAGWDEVMRSNMSKCVPDGEGGYTVIRREDNKILKPESYSPPDLAAIMRRFGYDV